MNLRNDRYLDPPDEPEAELCQSCGVELEWRITTLIPLRGDLACLNPFCPDKHSGVAKEMAELIVDTLSLRVKMLKRMIDTVSNNKEENK